MTTHFTWLQICQLLATTRHRTIDSKQTQGERIRISDLQCLRLLEGAARAGRRGRPGAAAWRPSPRHRQELGGEYPAFPVGSQRSVCEWQDAVKAERRRLVFNAKIVVCKLGYTQQKPVNRKTNAVTTCFQTIIRVASLVERLTSFA